jgi:hypothetical protein
MSEATSIANHHCAVSSSSATHGGAMSPSSMRTRFGYNGEHDFAPRIPDRTIFDLCMGTKIFAATLAADQLHVVGFIFPAGKLVLVTPQELRRHITFVSCDWFGALFWFTNSYEMVDRSWFIPLYVLGQGAILERRLLYHSSSVRRK